MIVIKNLLFIVISVKKTGISKDIVTFSRMYNASVVKAMVTRQSDAPHTGNNFKFVFIFINNVLLKFNY